MTADATPESPFRREFWLGRADARPLALLRMALGALLVVDLADRLRDLQAFYTASGIVTAPRSWADKVLGWSIFAASDNPRFTLALFLMGLLFAAAFALGYRTRLASALLWVFVVSLGHRNPYVLDGGDVVVQVLLFWGLFADLGARFSLDVALGRRPPLTTVPAGPLRVIQMQVAFIYVAAFLAKSGPASTWWGGQAVALAITSADWGRGLGPALARHPALCAALTYATLLIEGTFPLLVFSPWKPTATRSLAIAAGLALQAGIFLTMRVGVFWQVMPISYLVFVPPRWIDAASAWLRRHLGGILPAPRPLVPGVTAPPDRPQRLVLAFMMALFALGVIEPATLMGQPQNWRVLSPDVPTADVTWEAPGVLTDGHRVDLTDVVAPQLKSHDGFRYSRWHRLRNSLSLQQAGLLQSTGRYLCRRWNGQIPGPRLVRFELVATVQPRSRNESTRAEVYLRQDCTAPDAAP